MGVDCRPISSMLNHDHQWALLAFCDHCEICFFELPEGAYRQLGAGGMGRPYLWAVSTTGPFHSMRHCVSFFGVLSLNTVHQARDQFSSACRHTLPHPLMDVEPYTPRG